MAIDTTQEKYAVLFLHNWAVPQLPIITTSLGSELVTNGGFATDTDWTKDSAWSISGGEAVASPAPLSAENISQAPGISNGTVYELVYEIVSFTGNGFRALLGNASGLFRKVVGTHTERITAGSGSDLAIQVRASATGNIDNVSLKEALTQGSFSVAQKNMLLHGYAFDALGPPVDDGAVNWIERYRRRGKR